VAFAGVQLALVAMGHSYADIPSVYDAKSGA
jgi:hypothetical protein